MGCGASKKKENTVPTSQDTDGGDVPDDGVYRPFRRGRLPVGCRTTSHPCPDRPNRTLTVECYYPATELYRRVDTTREALKAHEMKRREAEDKEAEKEAKARGVPHTPREYAEGGQDTFYPSEADDPKAQLLQAQSAVRDALLDAEKGPFPVVVFCHGELSHRRACSHVCTHLASHGYVVFSADHPGDTVADLLHDLDGKRVDEDGERLCPESRAADRVADLALVHAKALAGEAGVPREKLRADDIGVVGFGVGATAALEHAKKFASVRAALLLAPSAGAAPMRSEEVERSFGVPCDRPLPVLYLCAKMDSMNPVDAVRPKFTAHAAASSEFVPPAFCKMLAMERTDHFHFLTYPQHSHDAARNPKWPVVVCASALGDPDDKGSDGKPKTELEYAKVQSSLKPLTELQPVHDVHAVVMTCTVAFMDANVRIDDDIAETADDFVDKIMGGKLYNVDMEVVKE